MHTFFHSSAQARIQRILRTTAKHFAIPVNTHQAVHGGVLVASEFKDPRPLRWTTQHIYQHAPVQGGISI